MLKVGGCSGGGNLRSFSGRAEFAAACLALGDLLSHSRPIAILTDSKGLMTVGSNWVGEGKDPLLRHSPDGDILGCIIEFLRTRVERGLSLFSSKSEPIAASSSKKRQIVGPMREDNVHWEGSSLRPICSWTEEGKERRCALNKTLSTRVTVHKQVANIQLSLHDNLTSRFLTRDNNSRSFLGLFRRDK